MMFFIDNKYSKWYHQIIVKARSENRKKGMGTYFESHHIIPKCEPFNGPHSKENRILLTAREHFLCHWLLTKMCEGICRIKMQHAIFKMLHNEKCVKLNLYGKNHYETARKHKVEAMQETARMKKSPMQGKKHSPESRKLMSLAKIGKPGHNIGKTWTLSVEARDLISDRLRGHEVTQETRRKLSDVLKGKSQNKSKSVCIHCGTENYTTQIKRYHNDNCKKKAA